jgi:RNA recognition motif-containing protein
MEMKIHVGNLSKGTTEPQLRESFEKFGTVDSLDIVLDRKTGEPRGFAFVNMPAADNAKDAMANLNGKELGGNRMAVSEARGE